MRAETGMVHDEVARRLLEAGQFYTRGRRELVELLATVGRPVTMPELLELRPRLTQSSLYRNMVDLEAAGVVQKIAAPGDRARYELADELIGHHHHLICTSCGAVDDFVVPPRTERQLEHALAKAVTGTGFQPRSHRLDLIGLCSRCA